MNRSASGRRRAGLLIPLFSIASSKSWGIGEFADLPRMGAWLRRAGQRVLLTLPLNEMPAGETSPYSALSAMALDPQFITLDLVDDFQAIGGESSLEPELRTKLDAARRASYIDYATVRELKQIALRRSFARFLDAEWRPGTSRASALRAFIDAQKWWLDDYALFRALQMQYGERVWEDWPEAVRTRDDDALARARGELADEVLYRQYVQWIASEQWAAARSAARDIAVFGDLPFAVGAESADVWAGQHAFRLDRSVGVPPDAFSATGQDWQLPAYRWDVLEAHDFRLLRNRAARQANLFDGYRIDHLVGFYRMYTRPLGGGQGIFTPSEPRDQQALGERIMRVFQEAGAEIIAEDLGVVPDFVRESLARLSIPGYRVFRWERRWHDPGRPFKDPVDYTPVSVATSGTHDTEPLAVWWESAPLEERRAILEIPLVREHLGVNNADIADSSELSPALRDAFLETLYASGSDLLVLPIQDVFGWRDRINQPATIGAHNWTWKLPWPTDRLLDERESADAAEKLRGWAIKHGR
ncbi:MAG TPA: 4-alpha-glucanotransferase [Vicinamibacterales bacterium]